VVGKVRSLTLGLGGLARIEATKRLVASHSKEYDGYVKEALKRLRKEAKVEDDGSGL
jgi:hypothetical protein